jgi:hypothetical protein
MTIRVTSAAGFIGSTLVQGDIGDRMLAEVL